VLGLSKLPAHGIVAANACAPDHDSSVAAGAEAMAQGTYVISTALLRLVDFTASGSRNQACA
jgi:hypothetical protein